MRIMLVCHLHMPSSVEQRTWYPFVMLAHITTKTKEAHYVTTRKATPNSVTESHHAKKISS